MSVALQMPMPTSAAQAELASQAELLDGLAELGLGLRELDLAQVDETAALRVSAELSRVVKRVLDITQALERLDAVEPNEVGAEPDWEPETWVGVRSGAPAAPRLGDVCFACTFELNFALRELTQARDFEARLSAIETARRKLYRALHAIARVAPEREREPSRLHESFDRRVDGELQSALAVRRLYAEFRQNLRRAEGDGSDAVLTALRYAAGALATLTASPHYRAVRISDATMLRRQHERLLEWSRAGQPRAAGLQLLEDITTSASLLRDINRRQELRAHDSVLIQTLLRGPPADRASWLASLDELAGLDDTLDELTARWRLGSTPDPVDAILDRLSLLA